MPVSFREVLPRKLFPGFLNMYIIPKGKNTIGMKTKYFVIIKEIIATNNEIEQEIHIISRDVFGFSLDRESPSIISWTICPINATQIMEAKISDSGKLSSGKKAIDISPALILIINQGKTI